MSAQDQNGVQSVSAAKLSEFVAQLFSAVGVPSAAAATVARGLVEADLEGLHSHGVMLVDMYIERLQKGSVSRNETASVVSERKGAVVLDAGHALGQLTGIQAMSIAIDKARQFSAGIVSVRHGFHFGTAGRYARQAAEAGCIGIAMCNTRPLMPAPGGAERVVGNNPIAIALPTAGRIPIVLDMATSEAAMGKIRMAEKANETIPPTWAVTAQGIPTTEPFGSDRGDAAPIRWRQGLRTFIPDRSDVRVAVAGSDGIGRCARSTATSACRTTVHISSSRSTWRIFATLTGFASRPPQPRSAYGPGNVHPA